MSLAKLRHQDHYIAVTKELREAGLEWREEFGGKHAHLLINVGGRVETEIMSVSPSDWRATRQAVAHIRRRIRQWRSGTAAGSRSDTAPDLFPTLEKETMDDTTLPTIGATELVAVVDGRLMADSRDVAERFGKERKHVHESIKRLIRQEPSLGSNFRPHMLSESAVSHYEMDRIGFSVLAMGFTGKSALQWKIRYSEAFEKMDAALHGSPAPVSDDTQALLEMLSDIRTAVLSSQQNSHATALEHIDGAKAAVLHYLRAYLKDPAAAFYEDVRTRNVATYERDRRLIEGMEALTRTVGAMLDKAGPALRDRPFIWTEWYDCDRLYSEWFPERHIPRRGLLSGIVSRALDRHCKSTRKFHHMEHRIVGGKGVNWWHKDSVFAWLEAGGRQLIADHLDRYSQEPRNVVKLALVN